MSVLLPKRAFVVFQILGLLGCGMRKQPLHSDSAAVSTKKAGSTVPVPLATPFASSTDASAARDAAVACETWKSNFRRVQVEVGSRSPVAFGEEVLYTRASLDDTLDWFESYNVSTQRRTLVRAYGPHMAKNKHAYGTGEFVLQDGHTAVVAAHPYGDGLQAVRLVDLDLARLSDPTRPVKTSPVRQGTHKVEELHVSPDGLLLAAGSNKNWLAYYRVRGTNFEVVRRSPCTADSCVVIDIETNVRANLVTAFSINTKNETMMIAEDVRELRGANAEPIVWLSNPETDSNEDHVRSATFFRDGVAALVGANVRFYKRPKSQGEVLDPSNGFKGELRAPSNGFQRIRAWGSGLLLESYEALQWSRSGRTGAVRIAGSLYATLIGDRVWIRTAVSGYNTSPMTMRRTADAVGTLWVSPSLPEWEALGEDCALSLAD
jgi:hypothetical protein